MTADPFLSKLVLSALVAVPGVLQVEGRIDHPPIAEASGLVASRTNPGVFWTLCDSGNLPSLYAIDNAGTLLGEFTITGAINLDWETLTLDDRDRLYIGDVGNNFFPGGWPVRQIYLVEEPTVNPAAEDVVRGALPILHIVRYRRPVAPFDVEAMVYWKRRLYLVEKVAEGAAGVYALEDLQTKETQSLRPIARLPRMPRVTGASLSSTGRSLALCSYSYTAIYALDPPGAFEKLGRLQPHRYRYKARAIEACTWAGGDLLLVSEKRWIYRLRPRGSRGE